ncbi:hypothetical protein AB0469_17940 [Streptomyces sp. NPDC093801]|uniref:hypothetical protein n=1 Tax=Streptomyces sp. NPDC093801 TaxID=3155203 RepID=UPI00344D68CC
MVVTALVLSLVVLLMPFGLDAFENFLFPRPPAPDGTEAPQATVTDPPEHEGQGLRYDLPGTV